jgi:hypothetical protein
VGGGSQLGEKKKRRRSRSVAEEESDEESENEGEEEGENENEDEEESDEEESTGDEKNKNKKHKGAAGAGAGTASKKEETIYEMFQALLANGDSHQKAASKITRMLKEKISKVPELQEEFEMDIIPKIVKRLLDAVYDDMCNRKRKSAIPFIAHALWSWMEKLTTRAAEIRCMFKVEILDIDKGEGVRKAFDALGKLPRDVLAQVEEVVHSGLAKSSEHGNSKERQKSKLEALLGTCSFSFLSSHSNNANLKANQLRRFIEGIPKEIPEALRATYADAVTAPKACTHDAMRFVMGPYMVHLKEFLDPKDVSAPDFLMALLPYLNMDECHKQLQMAIAMQVMLNPFRNKTQRKEGRTYARSSYSSKKQYVFS